MTPQDIRRLARDCMTDKQYDAWKLVLWDGRPKSQAARFLDIDRKTLDARLELASKKLVRVLRHHGIDEARAGRRSETSPSLSQGRERAA